MPTCGISLELPLPWTAWLFHLWMEDNPRSCWQSFLLPDLVPEQRKFIQPQLWYFQHWRGLPHIEIFSDPGVAAKEKCWVRHIVKQNLEQELYPTAGVPARLYVKSNLQPEQWNFSSKQSGIEVLQFACFRTEDFSYRCTHHSERWFKPER